MVPPTEFLDCRRLAGVVQKGGMFSALVVLIRCLADKLIPRVQPNEQTTPV